MKRLTTSKLIKTSFSRVVIWLMHSTKADESFTDKSVVPLKGLQDPDNLPGQLVWEGINGRHDGSQGFLPFVLSGDHRSVVQRYWKGQGKMCLV